MDSLARSHLARVLSLGALILVLQIPVGMVGSRIQERESRRDEVVSEIRQKWGGEQTLIGPLLVVPYEVESIETRADGTRHVRRVQRHASFLAEDLRIEGEVQGELRRRGIFEVPLYDATLGLTGRFMPPDLSAWEVPEDRVRWDRAVLSVQIADARAIQESVALTWNGDAIDFEPGLGAPLGAGSGIHAALPDPRTSAPIDFAFELRLHGSGGLYFAPFGRETQVGLVSDWPHPSFQGAWLPRERELGDDGFVASWRVPYLGRSYPQAWTSQAIPGDAIAASRFGVDFIMPVDPYRTSARAAKYDVLFLGLTFLALWLFEVLGGKRVHAVQYLLVGGGLSLFYLLLLALSEHIGVGRAYALASAGIVALIASYAVAVLGQRSRGAAIGGIVALLYGYLYVLLHNEDHALLIGSLGLFVVLSVVMWLTRRVDWFEKVAPHAGGDGE